MLYQVLISNHGVPCETWEVDAPDPTNAISAIRIVRMEGSAHSQFDTYDVVDASETIGDDDALSYAMAIAATRMPALAERFEAS